MAENKKTVEADEKTWQKAFYDNVFGADYEGLNIDRSTDGYTKGIIFEHKTNVRSYGESKALGQALIYLARFNRDGVPVPAKICLVSQDEQKMYVYDTENYMEIVNDIPRYANMKASDGIPGFLAGVRSETIGFDMSSAVGMQDVLGFTQKIPKTAKVEINEHNVYGWAGYYYAHAEEHKQKPEKKALFAELRNPAGALKGYTNPWTGQESDFKYIMDTLNDPMTQKKLGAFYTPPEYAKKASELVMEAIKRVPEGNDYVIIDRCAGTGNLEMHFDDEVLSHVILNTYELKEWVVLKDRYAGRVRYINPEVPEDGGIPELDGNGFLKGANAMTRDVMDNPEIKKHIDDPKCTVILFENPPYIEAQSIEYHRNGGTAADWKDGAVVQAMKEEVSGTASNDMANAFIWSGFKHLRQPTDSCIVFGPIKYWKAQNLINKKFLGGYAFNRAHFHAKMEACISCVFWSNEEDGAAEEISLDAFNIVNGEASPDGSLPIRKVHSLFSEKYYDKREDAADTEDGIVCENNGLEVVGEKNTRVSPKHNSNIIGYMVANSTGFDNPDLTSKLTRAGNYAANGFFLRSGNFCEKLPMFAASRYIRYNPKWTERSRIMKSADKADEFERGVQSGKLDGFLCKCLIFTCLEPQNHCRTLEGSDGRHYQNELCLDATDAGSTLAKQKLGEFLANGYEPSETEKALLEKWNAILAKAKAADEYQEGYTYGVYQIDEEINIKIQQGVKKDGTPNMVTKYGDLNNLLRELKSMLKDYYLAEIVPTLFEYEFLK